LPHSINTAPLDALNAYNAENSGDLKDIKAIKIPTNTESNAFFGLVSKAGIDINALYAKLLDDGMRSFEDSFEDLLGIL